MYKAYFLTVILALVVGIGWAKNCPNTKRSNSNKLICYYSKLSDIDNCFCSHVILPANSDIKAVEDVKSQINGVKIFVTVSEFNQGLVNLLKTNKVDGLEVKLQKLSSKNDISDFISTVNTKIGTGLDIFLSVPAKAELLAKYFDFKALSKHVDTFILDTSFLGASTNVTFHPSRLSGLWDMQNTDSVVDLVTGLGAPLQKLVITAPVQAFQFTLQNEEFTAPGSPALEIKSITRDELCEIMSDNSKNWTLERDEDQAGPYIFGGNQWIAFEDPTSVDIKAKYARVRGLAGMALKDVSLDGSAKCEESILEAASNGLSKQARAPRGAVLQSLEREILDVSSTHHESVQLSPFRISRVIDTEGHIHVVRQDTRVEFQCSRQGYFVHPRSCNRFYRCVKFNQLVDDFNVFEFDCPAGLAFDERVEVCVWPGSLPHGAPCAGSSEIAPVPKEKFECPSEPGYYADPENCSWFFACLDHGESKMSAYEFRCPFGLVFDGERLLCEWPWLVPRCADGLGIKQNSAYIYGGVYHTGYLSPAVSLEQYDGLGTLGTVKLGGITGTIEKPIARIYSNVDVGLQSSGGFLKGYQNTNGYINGNGLSYQSVKSLQNAGLLRINNGLGVIQPYQDSQVRVLDLPNVQYSGGAIHDNQQNIYFDSTHQNTHSYNLQMVNPESTKIDDNLLHKSNEHIGFGYNNINTHLNGNYAKTSGHNYVTYFNDVHSGNTQHASVESEQNTGEIRTLNLDNDNKNIDVSHVNSEVSSQSFTQNTYKPVHYVSTTPIPISVTTFKPTTNYGQDKLELSQYSIAQTLNPDIQININSNGNTEATNVFATNDNQYHDGGYQSTTSGYNVKNLSETSQQNIHLGGRNAEQNKILPVYLTSNEDISLKQSTGSLSTSSLLQYHGDGILAGQNNLQSNSYDAHIDQNGNYGQGVAGSINIIGGGFSAVGVPSVEINNNGENAHIYPTVSTVVSTIPTVTRVPVPGIKTATSFQSFEGGVVANVPGFQYKVQSNGNFGLRNVSTKFVNYVSTSPSPVYINHGLSYTNIADSGTIDSGKTGNVYSTPTTVKETPVVSINQNPQGYVYEKPKITFEERPLKINNNKQGYVYEKPKIPFEETPVKSVTVSSYSEHSSTDTPIITNKPQSLFVSTTIKPLVGNTILQQNTDNQHQGYVYEKPSVEFIETRKEPEQIKPIVHQYLVQAPAEPIIQPTVPTFSINNIKTTVDHVVEEVHRPYVQPQVNIQEHIPYQPQSDHLQKIERNQPVIISKFSIRKPVTQQSYAYENTHSFNAQQSSEYTKNNNLQFTHKYTNPQGNIEESPKVEVGYSYPTPAIRFEETPLKPQVDQTYQPEINIPVVEHSRPQLFSQTNKPPVYQQINHPKVVEFYQQQPLVKSVEPQINIGETPKVEVGYSYITPDIRFDEAKPPVIQNNEPEINLPVVKDISPAPKQYFQTEKPQIYQQINHHNVVEFYQQQPVLKSTQPQVAPVGQQPFIHSTVKEKVIYPPVQNSVVVKIPGKNVIIKEQQQLVPEHQIYYQQPTIDNQPQLPVVTPSSLIHTKQNIKPNIAYNQFTPYTYQNIIQHSSVSPKSSVIVSNIESTTPILKNNYFLKDTSEPKYEIHTTQTPLIKYSGGYNYPKPLIQFEEERQPAEEIPFIKKTAYVTGQKVETDCDQSSLPVVTGDVITTNYEKVRQKVFETSAPTSTSRTHYETNYAIPEVSTVVPVSTTRYITTTSRPITQYKYLNTLEENKVGYVYPKPTIKFEDGAKIVEHYQSPEYEKVKEKLFGPIVPTESYSTEKPIFDSVITPVVQKKLQPVTVVPQIYAPSSEQARTYYTTTTENYPNYEIVREQLHYQKQPSTTPILIPSTVRTTSRPIVKYSFSSLNNQEAVNEQVSYDSQKINIPPVVTQESEQGYIYPKPSISFEDGGRVVENYKFPQYEKVKEKVFAYTTTTATPRPNFSTTTETYDQPTTYYSTTTDIPDITDKIYIPISSTTPVSNTFKSKIIENYNAPEVTTLSRDYLPSKSRIFSTKKPDIVKITTLRPKERFYTTTKTSTEPSREYLPVRSRVKITTTEKNLLEEKNVSNEYGLRTINSAKTIVKQNGYHPMLSAKLGAQCLCVSNSLKLRNSKGKKLKIVVVNDDDENENEDSVITSAEDDDGNVVEDELNGNVVENYKYQPESDIVTAVPEVFITSSSPSSATVSTRNRRIRVRPISSTTELYSAPEEIFVGRKGISSRTKSEDNDSVSDKEIAKAVRTGLKLVKQAAKEGTEEAITKSFDRYGPGGVRSKSERLQGTIDCQRAGLFRHPTECNKFYACRWDCNKKRFTLHVFNCPVHLTFDNNLGACNWPSQGPACVDNTLISSE